MKKLLFTFFILLAPTLASAATLGKVQSNNIGLVGWWTFDGADMSPRVLDKSGSGNNGFLQNFAATTTSPGKVGQALNCDGINDSVNVGDLDTPNTMSISVWFKTTSISNQYIVGKDFVTSWMLNTSGTQVDFWTSNVNSSAAGLSLGEWHHAVGTFADGTRRLYIDGILRDTDAGQTMGTDNSLLLFCRTGANAIQFKGDIDDMRLYSRSLTGAEVSALYNSGSAKVAQSATVASSSPLSNGLVGYWTFDGSKTNWATGKTLDSSGAGNVGQLLSLSTSTTPIYGKIGQAMQFYTGSSPRVSVSSGIIGTSLPNGYAAGAWYKTDVAAGERVFERGGSDSFSIIVQSGFASCFTTANGGSFINNTVSIANATDGNWHHIICNYNAPQNRVELYFDGVMRGSVTAVGLSIVPSAASFTFPARGGLFQGIDDVRVYDRALSLSEIKALYNSSTKIGRSGAVTGTTTAPLSNGLIGYWTFDGSKTNWATGKTFDSSGSGNTGQLINMSTTTSPAIGKAGQALDFSRNPSAASIMTISSDIIGTSAASICAWVYTYRWPTSTYPLLDSGKIMLHLTSSGYFQFSSDYSTLAAGVAGSVTRNTWVHACATRDASGIANVYINGALSGAANQSSGTPVANGSTIRIGNFSNQDTAYQGKIDDVRMYNRALSPTEIKQLYNATK